MSERRVTTTTRTALGPNAIAALLGGLLILISAFLPWWDIGGKTENSNGVPLSFLWDSEATKGLKLLIVLLVVVILIVVGVMAAGMSTLTVVGGVLAILIPLLFMRSSGDAAEKVAGANAGFTDVMGFAPWLCLIGGLVTIVGGVMGYARRTVDTVDTRYDNH